MFENDDVTSEGVLNHVMTKGGKTRNSKKYSSMVDSIYMEMIKRTNSYYIYSSKLMELMLSAFRWEGFPDTINVRNLEETLHQGGSAVIARHKDTGDLCNFRLGASKGLLDIYGEPKMFNVNGHNYKDDVSVVDATVIYNNRLASPTLRTINHVAFKLAEADLIISQNLSGQSNPVLITGNDEQKKDIMAMYRSRGAFVPAVVGSKSLKEIDVKVMGTPVPFIVDKMNTHKHTVWNEGMTFLGIDNSNQEKKERMITGEVNANDGQINLFRESMILEREQAVERINEMFGLEVSVTYNDGPMDELAELFAEAELYKAASEVTLNYAEADAAEQEEVK